MYEPGHSFYEKLHKTRNFLLVRDDVGKPKLCVRDLPVEGHVYGFQPRKDAEGAGKLISSWQEHQASPVSKPGKAKVGKPRRRGLGFVPAGPFGVVHKPGTPIGKIMSNQFGNQANTEKHEVYATLSSQKPNPGKTRLSVSPKGKSVPKAVAPKK